MDRINYFINIKNNDEIEIIINLKTNMDLIIPLPVYLISSKCGRTSITWFDNQKILKTSLKTLVLI